MSRVAEIWGYGDHRFARIRAQFVPDAERDPYDVLGVSPDMPLDQIKTVWRGLVRNTHPDSLMARGLPEEAVKMAEKRMIVINRAWEQVQDMRT